MAIYTKANALTVYELKNFKPTIYSRYTLSNSIAILKKGVAIAPIELFEPNGELVNLPAGTYQESDGEKFLLAVWATLKTGSRYWAEIEA